MRICFIGTGIIAREHLKSIKHRGLEVMAVCSRGASSKKFAKDHNISKRYDNPAKMIDECQPEAVFLLTPPKSYRIILHQIKGFEKALFIEKPLGINVSEANELLPLIPDKTFVGLNRRFYEYVPTVKELLKDKEKVLMQACLAERRIDINSRTELEKQSWLMLNGIHFFDLLFYLLGKPKKILKNDKWGFDEDIKQYQYRTTCFETTLGHHVQIAVSMDSPGGWRASIFIPKSEIQIYPLELCSIKVYGSKTIEILANKTVGSGVKAGFSKQLETFIDGIISHSLPKEWVSFNDALDTMKAIELILAD